MPQTIKIFQYEVPLSLGLIHSTLSKKKFKMSEPDENDPDNEITLTHEIQSLERHQYGISGGLRYFTQKEFEFAEGQKYHVVPHEFGFLFSPENEFLILHGDSTFYIRVLRFFAEILHSGDDIVHSINIPKKKMYDLMEKIINMKKGRNNLEEAGFFHNGKPLGTLKRLSFTTIPDACGTEHILFKKNYDNCTHWNAQLRIYKCNGLQDIENEKGHLLRMSHDGKFSATNDYSLKEWNRFVVETVKKSVGF